MNTNRCFTFSRMFYSFIKTIRTTLKQQLVVKITEKYYAIVFYYYCYTMDYVRKTVYTNNNFDINSHSDIISD